MGMQLNSQQLILSRFRQKISTGEMCDRQFLLVFADKYINIYSYTYDLCNSTLFLSFVLDMKAGWQTSKSTSPLLCFPEKRTK